MLSCLVETPDPGEEAWRERFNAMIAANGTYFPIVIVSKETDQIVAMGTVVIELKFFRGLTRVGHVEDIVVDTRLHSKGLGKIIVQTVMKIAESKGCSNIILNCSDEKKREFQAPLPVQSTPISPHSTCILLTRSTPSCSTRACIRCLVAFYEKCGFSYSGLQMAKRISSTT